jgi:hypothetical protein
MAKLMKRKTKTLIVIFIISVILSLKFPSEIEEEERAKREKLEKEEKTFSVFLQRESATSTRERVVSLADELHGLEYDFYRQNCPQAESIVRSTMARIYMQQNDISFGLLRLLFHDCFIKVCYFLLLNSFLWVFLNWVFFSLNVCGFLFSKCRCVQGFAQLGFLCCSSLRVISSGQVCGFCVFFPFFEGV